MHLERFISRCVLITVALLSAILAISCQNVDVAPYSYLQESELEEFSTYESLYELAIAESKVWQSNSYLNSVHWTAKCDHLVGQPSRVGFNFISQEQKLLRKQLLLGIYRVDYKKGIVQMAAGDFTEAMPPDSETRLLDLPVDYEEAIHIAHQSIGDSYMKNQPDCEIDVWLQDNQWRFTYRPENPEFYEDRLIVYVDGLSGDHGVGADTQ